MSLSIEMQINQAMKLLTFKVLLHQNKLYQLNGSTFLLPLSFDIIIIYIAETPAGETGRL
jgi:hypothetical protein